MNEQITKIATKHQRQMSSVHPHAIIGTIEDAIEDALKDSILVKTWDKPQVSKRISLRREALLIDFMDWLKEQPGETSLMDSEEIVSKYLEGN